MCDSDDELVLKDKNDILNEELGYNTKDDENIDDAVGQFDLFSKMVNHNAKFDRQKNVITATDDQIEFIDENIL